MTKPKSPKKKAAPKAKPGRAAKTTPEAKPAAGSAATSVYRAGTVALVGRPNAGKSTLLNALMGEKIAIISDKPQTTRMNLLGIKTTDRRQIVFIDTPGIHKPLHALNKRMMSFFRSSLETADAVCLLIDATQKFGHGDAFVIETLKKVTTPVLLLINKVDAVRKDKVLPFIDRYKDLMTFREIVPISALKGDNLDVLETLLSDLLPAGEKIYPEGSVSDQSERFFLSEIVREKILARVSQELPFTTAVLIDGVEMKDGRDGKGRPRPVAHVRASVFVEKDNHRKIIIGRGGELIKAVGIEARREMEEILESKVYLDLQVRVKPRWRDSRDVLDLIEGQRD